MPNKDIQKEYKEFTIKNGKLVLGKIIIFLKKIKIKFKNNK